jgi:hypothetical protein
MVYYAIENSLNFFLYEKYDIEASKIQQTISKEESDKLNENSEYNPNIEFMFRLFNYDEKKNLSNNFFVI